ncbi:Polysaccharide deacetylase (plasmid) [Rubrobacter radiotolerans]|uniref:Polysaccharide deacetylase n=1 Tax=Rubrobacter radiotolerans TaxID=42256 RepID=A0A023X7T0_RUBRA|nr:polysaccharide deacetylase [Rubrobacter radiotolerans]AHY48109.1 Polysaccharide deacetylase [Rubrobacter radiotolerans]MDX5895383.1 polysaccharide deacetylase [Rubrobacter radiotolerans]SMC01737.1 Polysaccharide deacetylase [Rubrobacter radiotolerans DSM 5868]
MIYPPSSAPAGDWLGDAAAVALLTFDLDAEAPVLAAGEHYAADLSAMSHQAYGPRVGVPRILDLLGAYGLKATFFVPGVTAERWPRTVERVLAAGHEVALHGYSHRPLPDMSRDEQARDLERCLGALADLGVEPEGYRAPYWRLTRETLYLLPTCGILYDSSLMDDDRPYRLHLGGEQIAELPVHWSLDDWEQYAFLPEPDIGERIENPRDVARLWTEELDAMRKTNSLCVLTCHPFLSGRPSRLRAIEDFVQFAGECTDVRFSTASELAKLVL